MKYPYLLKNVCNVIAITHLLKLKQRTITLQYILSQKLNIPTQQPAIKFMHILLNIRISLMPIKMSNFYVHEQYNVPKSITNLKYHAIYIIRIFLKVYLSDTKNEIFNYIKKYLYFFYLITRNQVKLLPTKIINLCENKRFIF